ncbi:hypothetical protein Bca101_050257 [Brassica carinata]
MVDDRRHLAVQDAILPCSTKTEAERSVAYSIWLQRQINHCFVLYPRVELVNRNTYQIQLSDVDGALLSRNDFISLNRCIVTVGITGYGIHFVLAFLRLGSWLVLYTAQLA